MKQECLFEIKANLLFLKSSGEQIDFGDAPKISFAGAQSVQDLALKKNSVLKIPVGMAQVCLAGGGYDENFLAELRLFLKKFEEPCAWVIIEPSADGLGEEGFAEALCHTARRLKDCQSVIGMALPDGLSAKEKALLTAALKKKHPHYIYFAESGQIFMA